MPLQNVFQINFVEIGLLKQLFDARLVLLPSHTGGNGNDIFGAKNPGGHTFIFDAFGFMNGFPGQAVRGKKRDGKSPDKQMFAFNLPTLRLKVRVDSGNACRQILVFRDKKISAS